MMTYTWAAALHMTSVYISLLLSLRLPMDAKLVTNSEQIKAASLLYFNLLCN